MDTGSFEARLMGKTVTQVGALGHCKDRIEGIHYAHRLGASRGIDRRNAFLGHLLEAMNSAETKLNEWELG